MIFNIKGRTILSKANQDIRLEISEAGLTQWQVAFKAGISAQTLSNWLRLPLSDNQKQRVTKAINELKGELQNA